MLAFFGPPPKGIQVRHLNGNPKDNRLENLAYGTRSDNAKDAIRHGTGACSRKNINNIFKITEHKAIQIAKDTRKTSIIAKEFNICKRHVTSIKRGEYWGDVTEGIRVPGYVPPPPNKKTFNEKEIKFICDKNNPRKYLCKKFKMSLDVIKRVRRDNIRR